MERRERSPQDELYRASIEAYGTALDRLAAGYEADTAKRQDLRQEIHLQLWRSFRAYDGRCSLGTWTFRVAHNVAVSYVQRELRHGARFVSLDKAAESSGGPPPPDFDRQRKLERLAELIRGLKPLDRQVMLCYLEEMEATAIAEITGLSAANVAIKVHRTKALLARQFLEERDVQSGSR